MTTTFTIVVLGCFILFVCVPVFFYGMSVTLAALFGFESISRKPTTLADGLKYLIASGAVAIFVLLVLFRMRGVL